MSDWTEREYRTLLAQVERLEREVCRGHRYVGALKERSSYWKARALAAEGQLKPKKSFWRKPAWVWRLQRSLRWTQR